MSQFRRAHIRREGAPKYSALEFAQQVAGLNVLLDRIVAPILDDYVLTRAECDVLAILRTAYPGGLRPKDLSTRLLITPGGISNVLHRLEHRSLLLRTADPADGRGHTVQLTTEGHSLANAVARAVEGVLQRTFTAVPNSQRTEATADIRGLLDALSTFVLR